LPDTAVAEERRGQYGVAAPQNGSLPGVGGGPPERRLPRRRSRRDAYVPGSGAVPAASTPPGTPEEAGDWMQQFIEGGRSLTEQDAGLTLPEFQDTPASPETPDVPGPTDTAKSLGTPESPEGRT
jgi:hypothetical protein